MKKITILMLTVFAFTTIFSCKPSEEQVKSVDSLMVINKNIDSVYRILNEAYESYVPATLDMALENLNKYLTSAKETVQNFNSGSDVSKLQAVIIEKIDVMKSIAENESVEQVRLYKIPDTEFTTELRNKWDGIAKNVEQKINEVNKKVEDTRNELTKSLFEIK